MLSLPPNKHYVMVCPNCGLEKACTARGDVIFSSRECPQCHHEVEITIRELSYFERIKNTVSKLID